MDKKIKRSEEEILRHKEYRDKWRAKNKEKIAQQQKLYAKKNKDKLQGYYHQYYLENKGKIDAYSKAHYKKNKEKRNKQQMEYYTKNKDRYQKNSRIWKTNNIEKWKEYYREYENTDKRKKYKKEYNSRLNVIISRRNRGRGYDKKRRSNFLFRFNSNISRSIRLSLHERGISKNGRRWEEIVGYSCLDLISHLESLFRDGMSWDNYGEWHIDHIIPVSFFKFNSPYDTEFKMCWRLENLRPLWASENISKKDKIIRI